MSSNPCPQCQSEFAYQDDGLWICPECVHEWQEDAAEEAKKLIKDANGTPLADGDTVILIKDLKVKGSSQVIKQGTKVKNIRLQEDEGGHNIGCKIDGTPMNLKSEFVKKSA